MNPLFTRIAAGDAPDLEAIIAALGPPFLPLFEAMKSTPQDPEWHGEGDVYTHTRMVLAACYRHLETDARTMPPEHRLALVLGAALHDIAKPFTTRVQEIKGAERIVAPRHADSGRSRIAAMLADVDIPTEVRRNVLMLVGHHHDPIRLARTEAPVQAYRRLARIADPELLYHLEIADMKGRICNDLQKQLDFLELFRLYIEEAGIRQNTHPYPEWEEIIAKELDGYDSSTISFVLANAIRNAEAGIISTPYEEVARSYSYRDSYPELTVLFGPSSSGKSTWVAAREGDYRIISLDRLREEIAGKRGDQSRNSEVFQEAKERLKEHLRRHEKVIWDATSLYRDQRNAIVELGMKYRACVTLVVFHLPESLLYERNRARSHPVPDAVLQRQIERMNFPYPDEAHHVLYVDESGNVLY